MIRRAAERFGKVRGTLPRRCGPVLATLFAACVALPVARAEVAVGEDGKLRFYGDARFRVESDWNSAQSDGMERSDRERVRIRLRLGFRYVFDDHFSIGGRLRTGNPEDPQSPHQTLGDEFDTKTVNLDKAYLQGSWKRAWVWLGKNGFTFLTQDEILWDEDVTPEGVAAGFPIPLGKSRLKLEPVVGYFIAEDSSSSNGFDQKSDVGVVQVNLNAPLSETDLKFGSGMYLFRDNPETVDPALVDLDYTIVTAGAKATFRNSFAPVTIGVDYLENLEDYPSTLFNADETTGYVIGASLGNLKEERDWIVAWYYAHVEKYAVVARLAQDDWLRWGSDTDTRASNFEGHEFRVAYVVRPFFNVMLRVYRVEGIEPESPTAVAEEDGTRARLDLNMSF